MASCSRCTVFSSRGPSSCRVWALGGNSFSSSQGTQAHWLWCRSLIAPWFEESFPDQGLKLCPLHWQGDSYPLYHQRSPRGRFLISCSILYSSEVYPRTSIIYYFLLTPWRRVSFTQVWKWSRFSYVQLFVTPWAVAHLAPPSMGFSRQEYWSGLPFPSPFP